MTPKRLLPWMTAILILVLDRWSKGLVLEHLPFSPFTEIKLVPGLSLTHVHNSGIAFSLFADGGPLSKILLHAVILTSVVVIAWILVRHSGDRITTALAFGLILGGAVGNLIDRMLYGWVIDFIHVWVEISGRIHAWPDFNVADSAISVGAVLLVIAELTNKNPKNEDFDASDSD
ncbi:MAG: signal peptidase II [Acidobacteria bacterium]|nr:MAG: signal peptidase II [Acidobacteriota bacterium]